MFTGAMYFLTMRRGPEPHERYQLNGETISVGRHTDNDITIAEHSLSRYHARLTFTGGNYVVEDLDSANGTFVNDAPIAKPTPLRDGDLVQLGTDVLFVYDMDVNLDEMDSADEFNLNEVETFVGQLTVDKIQELAARQREAEESGKQTASMAAIQAARAIEISANGDLGGELNVAGRDVVTTNIFQGLSLPTTTRGKVILGSVITITFLIVVMFFALDAPGAIAELLTGPPFPPADEGETLVIVTNFVGEGGITSAARISQALVDRVEASNLTDVRIERLEDAAPQTAQEAREIAEEYNATLIIWGTSDSNGIEPRYEIIAPEGLIPERPELGATTAEFPAFSAYVFEGVPSEFEYLMLFSLGQIAFFSGDYEQSAELFRQAQDINLGDRTIELGQPNTYLLEAFSLIGAGQTREATTVLLDSLRFFDTNITLPAFYGITPPQQPQADIERLTSQLANNPDDPALLYDRALRWFVLRQFDKTLADLDDAIASGTNDPYVYFLHGLTIFFENGFSGTMADQQVVDDIEHALSLDPAHGPSYVVRSGFRFSMGDHAGAIEDANRAIESGLYVPGVIATRGIFYDLSGDSQAAVADYRVFIDSWTAERDIAVYIIQARLTELEEVGP